MERKSELTRSHPNKVGWDYSAFVEYALQVIAIIKEREKSVLRRALAPK
jgi:hypothetical protein